MWFCKTCKHISQGSTFSSNVTKMSYDVISHSTSMNCTSNNVVYLINVAFSMWEKLVRSWERSSLKRLTNLYLYHHFSCDSHSEDDLKISQIVTGFHTNRCRGFKYSRISTRGKIVMAQDSQSRITTFILKLKKEEVCTLCNYLMI